MECPICNENDVKQFYPSGIKNYRERKKKGLKIWRPYCRSCSAEHQREYLSRPEVKERRREYEREYHHRPEVKERRNKAARKTYAKKKKMKKKKMTAAQRKKRNEYLRRYNQRPEVKAKRHESYLRKKEEQRDAISGSGETI